MSPDWLNKEFCKSHKVYIYNKCHLRKINLTCLRNVIFMIHVFIIVHRTQNELCFFPFILITIGRGDG